MPWTKRIVFRNGARLPARVPSYSSHYKRNRQGSGNCINGNGHPKVQHDIQKNLGMVNAKAINHHLTGPIYITKYVPKQSMLIKDIIKFIKNNQEKSGIIYRLSRKKGRRMAEILFRQTASMQKLIMPEWILQQERRIRMIFDGED